VPFFEAAQVTNLKPEVQITVSAERKTVVLKCSAAKGIMFLASRLNFDSKYRDDNSWFELITKMKLF